MAGCDGFPTFWADGAFGLGRDRNLAACLECCRRLELVPAGPWDIYLLLLRAGVWTVHFSQSLVVLHGRPRRFLTDAARRLHCTDGPALLWPDGNAEHWIHGVRVDSRWVEHTRSLEVSQILRQRNVEVRRVLLELYGVERALKESGAEQVDASGMARRLWRITAESMLLVEVRCPSTRKAAYLQVPPDLTSCAAAVAWTFGLREEEYRRAVEA